MPPDVRFLGLNAPNSISDGAPPQIPLGELTALSRPLAGFQGPISKRKEGRGKGREGRRGKRKRKGGMEGKGRGEGKGGAPPNKNLPLHH